MSWNFDFNADAWADDQSKKKEQKRESSQNENKPQSFSGWEHHKQYLKKSKKMNQNHRKIGKHKVQQ